MIVSTSLLQCSRFHSFLIRTMDEITEGRCPRSGSLSTMIQCIRSRIGRPDVTRFLVGGGMCTCMRECKLSSTSTCYTIFSQCMGSPLLIGGFRALYGH